MSNMQHPIRHASDASRFTVYLSRSLLLLSLLGLLALTAACSSSGSGSPAGPPAAALDLSTYFPPNYVREGEPQAVAIDKRGPLVYLIFYRLKEPKGPLLGGYFSGLGDPAKGKPVDMVWQELSREAKLGDLVVKAEVRDLLKGDGKSELLLNGMTGTAPLPATLSLFQPVMAGDRLTLNLIHTSFSGNRGVEVKDMDGNAQDDIVERNSFQGTLITSTVLCRKGVYIQANSAYLKGESWYFLDFCDERVVIEPEEVVMAYYKAKGTGTGDDSDNWLTDEARKKYSSNKVFQMVGSLTVEYGDNRANKRLVKVSLYDGKTHQPAGNATWLVAYIPTDKDKPGVWRMEDRR